MDEMFFKKLEEDERLRLEAEKISGQFENETGGYSDIDIYYAKNKREVQPKDELDDDEMERWLETRQKQKNETRPEEESKGDKLGLKSQEDANDVSDQSIELPQGIKDQITDLELQQKEKLAETKLQANFKPRTSALSNLEKMFKNYPVVTTQTSKLRFEKVINFAAPPAEEDNSVLSKSLLFSSLMTSVNPFAKFII